MLNTRSDSELSSFPPLCQILGGLIMAQAQLRPDAKPAPVKKAKSAKKEKEVKADPPSK